MTTKEIFIQPIDVLMLRGNRQFGGGGDWGEALMPPWPSLFSGAIRSAILSQRGVNIAKFLGGGEIDTKIRHSLGFPPGGDFGTFRVTKSNIARITSSGVERLYHLPADLEVSQNAEKEYVVRYKKPVVIPPSFSMTSARTPQVAFTQGGAGGKGGGSYLLTAAGFEKWRRMEPISANDLLSPPDIYSIESRLGIGLDPTRRTAQQSLIYTTDAISMKVGYGFLVKMQDSDDLLDESGLLRLGGDGRGATYSTVISTTEAPAESSPSSSAAASARIYLNSPALFEGGWYPDGSTIYDNGGREIVSFEFNSVSCEIIAATSGRHRTVSGWDLSKGEPKESLRSIPSGAVYFLDNFDGDPGELTAVTESGLWTTNSTSDQRRAEGFNQCEIAFSRS